MAEYNVFKLEGNCLKIDLGRYKGCADLSSLASDISANWGSIGGTLSAQTDLQTALNLKANTSALSGYLPITGGVLTGIAGNGKVTFPTQSSAPSTPSTGFSLYANATNALSWKGANGFVRVFDGIANTADRTYTLPDASGTFGLLGSTQTWTGTNTFIPPTSVLSTGSVNLENFYPTVNQSGTAGYIARRTSVYEQTTGSGTKLLLDLGTNSAANGGGTHTSKFSVDNGGSVTAVNYFSTGSLYSSAYRNNGGNIIFGSSGGTQWATAFTTGRWFFGASPTDDGVSTININGAAKVQGTLDITGGAAIGSSSGNGLHISFNTNKGIIQSVEQGVSGRELQLGGYPISFYNTQLGVEFARFAGAGTFLLNTIIDDTINKLQVNGSVKSTQYRLSALNTAPSSPIDKGTLGEIRVTSTYIYVCTATNVWVRTDLTSW